MIRPEMTITSLTHPPLTTKTLGLGHCTGGNERLFVMNVKASQSTEVGLHCPIGSEITAFSLSKLMKSTNTGQMYATKL